MPMHPPQRQRIKIRDRGSLLHWRTWQRELPSKWAVIFGRLLWKTLYMIIWYVGFSNPPSTNRPTSKSADLLIFSSDHEGLEHGKWEMGKGICGFAGRMSINITWSLSCYLPHLYAGLTLYLCIWVIIESLQSVSALAWSGRESRHPSSSSSSSLSSQPQTVPRIRNTDTSAWVKRWQLLMSCLVTVKCQRLSTRCFEFLSFSRGALQDKLMSIYASVLSFEKSLEYDPKQNRLRKLIPSTLNRFSDRRMKMFPCPWTKIPCTSVYYPKQSLEVAAARRVTTFVMKLQSKKVVAKLTFYKSKEF